MKAAPSYGTRSRRGAENAGIRQAARTYGKARIGTYAPKAGGHITVESDAERLTGHLLNIDPRVRSFKPQPFTVDLIAERLLFTREEVKEARRERGCRGAKRGVAEYTPDFAVVGLDGLQQAYEVKLQGWEGDDAYWAKLEHASRIMQANCYPLTTVVIPANERHPVLVNAQLLKTAQPCKSAHLSQELIDRIERYCSCGPVLQRELCAALDVPTGLIPVLLLCGVLRADLIDQCIGSSLGLSAAWGDLGHLCLIEELVADGSSFRGLP